MTITQTISSSALIPLSAKKKWAVQIGCICLMLSIAMFGLSLSVLLGPILTKMNQMQYFSLLAIFGTLGISILTPIGGKLGDLFGRRNMVIVAGSVAAICGLGLGLVQTIAPFLILRLLLGVAQGAFLSAPYIIVREINEARDVPRSMGMLASSIAIGGFVGSIIAGALTDLGYLNLAIIFPIIPLSLGVLLIAVNMPNNKRQGKVYIDKAGMVLLTATISAFILSMNYGPKIGWSNPTILAGFAIAVVSLYLLVRVERKSIEPVIPLHLFANKQYRTLLLVGFLAWFYTTPMNIYTPLAVQKILNASVTASSALQLPRTVIVMILPTIVGVWVAKKKDNFWKAMALAMILVIVCFAPLSFTTKATTVIMFMVALAVTGIAESFRSTSVTPYLQTTLSPHELGVGTALSNFVNSLSSLFASALSGVIFDAQKGSINTAINSIFITLTVVALAGLLVVILLVRKQIQNRTV